MTKNMVSLQGRTIVVTGAAQGIGKATAELAIELGANVVAVDLNGEALGAVLAALPAERVMKVVGACSLVSWFAVLYCGRMLPYLGTGN